MDVKILYSTLLGISLALISCESKQPEKKVLENQANGPVKESTPAIDKGRLVKGLTLEQRISLIRSNVYGEGYAEQVRKYFPDLIKLDLIEGEGEQIPEGDIAVAPILFHYSKEADLTFAICAQDRNILVYPGELDHLPTYVEINRPSVWEIEHKDPKISIHPGYKKIIKKVRMR